MLSLDGRTVAITGAAGMLGGLLAEGMAERGATIVGIDRVAGSGADEVITADLADPGALAAVAETLGRRRIDMLVNVAGVAHFGPLAQQGLASIRLGYAVNLIAPTALTAAVLPQMLARGGGHIVNIGSMLGSIPFPYFVGYASAKAGLAAFSDALRREVDGRGIVVTHVAPRAVRTPLNSALIETFHALTKTKVDAPERVANRVLRAIERCERRVSIGWPERLFARMHALSPATIDRGLRPQIAAARSLFAE